jgi:hypothetical protein
VLGTQCVGPCLRWIAGHRTHIFSAGLSLEAQQSLDSCAASALRLCLSMRPLDAQRATQVLRGLAPSAGWCADRQSVGAPEARPGPSGPKPAQQAAAAAFLVEQMLTGRGPDIGTAGGGAGGASGPRPMSAGGVAGLARFARACMTGLASVYAAQPEAGGRTHCCAWEEQLTGCALPLHRPPSACVAPVDACGPCARIVHCRWDACVVARELS